ncbi:hypothetical protein [Streptomyces sp. SCSIO ZS0520]|uniref:hypothetical protein n=1 Tax=Streptomyces sp. SCSIO ZS0520 TaxID=2892996 RepID=UPI0021DA1A1D|nr:hypothetical protein [Streptomyces sp. SCSIO ZS0520]
MQNKPVDTSRLGLIRCVAAPEARMTPDGQQRRDRDGALQWVTALAVRQQEGRRIDVLEVVVSGSQPEGITEGAVVTVRDLWSVDWTVDGRSGTSWRAAAITAAPGPRAESAASGRKGGAE